MKIPLYRAITINFIYYGIAFLLSWVVLMGYTRVTLAGNLRHTYQLPSTACTNTLVSDWWTFDFMREWFFELYIIPFASLYLMLWSKEKVAWGSHLALLVVFICWGLANFGYDIDLLVNANADPESTGFLASNYARSYQWCLYYGGSPNTNLICANTGQCAGVSPVNPAYFNPNWPFLIRFVMNIIFIGFFLVDMWLTIRWARLLGVSLREIPSPEPTPASAPAPAPASKVNSRIRYNVKLRNE